MIGSRRAARLFAVTLIALAARPALANLVFSTDAPSYTIASLGQTTNVGLYVTQVAGNLPNITASNPLLTGGLQLTFATTGAAVETGFTPSLAWDNSSVGSTTSGATTVVSLTVLSILGIGDLSKPLLLGTFTFTGRAVGSTTVQVAIITPGANFIDSRGDILDPANKPTAAIQVSPTASVPEPGSLLLLVIGGGGVGGVCARRRR